MHVGQLKCTYQSTHFLINKKDQNCSCPKFSALFESIEYLIVVEDLGLITWHGCP